MDSRILSIVRSVASQNDLPGAISSLLTQTAALLRADRCTLFLVERGEPGYLYIGLSRGAVRRGDHKKLHGIRIPIDRTSVAGYVAFTGSICNIPNAYADPRFDATVDKQTDYSTRTILAIPLKDGEGNVIAVLQAINKQTAEEQNTPTAAADNAATVNNTTSDSPISAVLPSDFAEAAKIPVTWPVFSAEDCSALEAVADVTGSILLRLTLQAIATREKSRSDYMVSVLRQISTASTSARLNDVVEAVIAASYKLLDAQRVTLFLVDESRRFLVIASSKDAEGVQIPIEHGIVGYCATTGMPVCIPDAYKDPRFDRAVDDATGFRTQSVLCVPIRDAGGEVVGVLQAINRRCNGASPFEALSDADHVSSDAPATVTPRGIISPFHFPDSNSETTTTSHITIWPFTLADIEILEGMAAHAAIALRSAQMLEDMSRAQKTTSALLDIVQSTATDSSSSSNTVQSLVQKIIDAVYQLLDCERVTLYLVDSVKQELWMAVCRDSDAEGARIPIGQGLAGFVAHTGMPLNIPDAYRDARFDSSFDQATGFRTRSVLVWPISFQNAGADASSPPSVIAVLQAINKRSNSMVRVASSQLLRPKARVGSLFSTSGPAAAVQIRNVHTTSKRFDRREAGSGTRGGVTLPSKEMAGYDRFDANDEKAMSAFCAEVAVALKRRSVEAAFLKVLSDASSGGKAIPDEFNVSLLALYTDAGTSARLHTSVLVRRLTVEKNLSWPTAIRLMNSFKDRAKRAKKTVEDVLDAPVVPSGGDGAEPISVPSKPSSYALPETSALSVWAAMNVGSPEDELMDADDPVLTWNWSVFDYPLVGVQQAIMDPVLPLEMPLPPTASAQDIANGESYLLQSVLAMFRQYALLRRFNVDDSKFANFLGLVRTRYPPNPFHNFYHAVSVLHATFLILGTTNAGDMLTYRDIFAAMIAALGHDIDHPGHNNAYEMNAFSPLALMHNDDAVLERHHSHTLFRTLFDPKCDFLSVLPTAEVKGLRQTIINAILHTDMTKHFGTLADLADRFGRYQEQVATTSKGNSLQRNGSVVSVTTDVSADVDVDHVVDVDSDDDAAADAISPQRQRRASGNPGGLQRSVSDLSHGDRGTARTASKIGDVGRTKSAANFGDRADIFPFDRMRDEDRNELVAVIVHTADLSGQAYPRSISNNWNSRILAEFRAQAAKERAQGLPVAPFMASLDTPLACAKLQCSFVSNIVLPLWQRVADLLPGLEEPLSNLTTAKLQFERDVSRFEKESHPVVSSTASCAPMNVGTAHGTLLMPPLHMGVSMASSHSIIVGDEDEEAKAVSTRSNEAKTN